MNLHITPNDIATEQLINSWRARRPHLFDQLAKKIKKNNKCVHARIEGINNKFDGKSDELLKLIAIMSLTIEELMNRFSDLNKRLRELEKK